MSRIDCRFPDEAARLKRVRRRYRSWKKYLQRHRAKSYAAARWTRQ